MHTPGPWTWGRTSHFSGEEEFCAIIRQGKDEMVAERVFTIADARLMAAAPELLEALASMVDMFARHIEGRPGPDDAARRWDAARRAIAKANGGER